MAKEMANGCHLLRKNTNIFLYAQLLDTLLEIINRKAGMMQLAVCLQKQKMAVARQFSKAFVGYVAYRGSCRYV